RGELLGLDRVGRAGLTSISLVVIAVVAGAFVLLVRESWRRRVRLTPIVIAGGLSLALSVAGPLLLSRDVYSYAAYGRMFALHGTNPYVAPPSAFPGDPFTSVVSSEWKNTRSVYGPTFVLVSAGIARATSGSVPATIEAFKALAGVALAGAALLVALACRKIRPDRAAMAVVVVLLNPVLILHTVGGGHNDALVAFLLALALWLWARGRSVSYP